MFVQLRRCRLLDEYNLRKHRVSIRRGKDVVVLRDIAHLALRDRIVPEIELGEPDVPALVVVTPADPVLVEQLEDRLLRIQRMIGVGIWPNKPERSGCEE